MELQTMPLKFRVWDKEENRFRHWCDEPIEMDLWRLHELFDLSDEEEYEHYIVSQDTGLKDKNGENVFTGDIVGKCNTFAIVVYEKGEIQYRTSTGDYWMVDVNEVEVMGNIWQNKELLEEK